MKLKIANIVFLKISSWKGISVGAVHCYGALSNLGGGKRYDVDKPITKAEANRRNKKAGWVSWTGGDRTESFDTKESVIYYAKRQFNKRFPHATALVLGNIATAEPQTVLVGPQPFKQAVNKLVKRAERIGYWDNEAEMRQICNEWVKLWPIKYR